MQHFKVKLYDSITLERVVFHVYGKISTMFFDNKERRCIINEYGVTIFVETYNIISIEQVNPVVANIVAKF